MSKAKGFTLVELLVVFAMMAFLVALVPIAFDGMRTSSQYRDALRAIRTDLRSARYQALSEGRPVTFRVDLRQRTYGVVGQPLRTLPEPLAVQATVANTQLLPDAVAAIQFLPGGGATGGSIDVFRTPGNGTRLRVDWLSGQVSVEPIHP